MKRWRVNLIFFLIILFGATIIGRLIYIQILSYDYYKALAQGQQKDFRPLKGTRGKVFFNGGEVLATNIKKNYVFASPAIIEEKEKTAKELSQILDLEEELILEKLKGDSLFEPIKIDLAPGEEELLEEIDLPGVYLEEAIFRAYPQESMASQTIGFLGGEGSGQYGIEGYYDEFLQGEEGFQERRKGSLGYFFSEADEDLTKGSDIFLTLDYNIQFIAEELLEQAKENLNIEGGQIIVLEPNSGKIIALANFPNFDPNDYSEIDFELFQNGAIQKLFEPGSAFKPITMAGAFNEGKLTPQTTYLDTGSSRIGGHTIENYNQRVFDEQTMTEVLEKSINNGAVFAEQQLGHELFLEYINRFGFFEPTGIDLQGEVFSENKEFKKGYEINFATASFGQGIEITPIQLIRAFCAIANGGKLVKPYIVEKVVKDGKIIETQPKILKEQVISQRTASQLTAMLVSVVENGPYTKRAKISGYYVAGKTGTAQVSWPALGIDKEGYSDKTWQSFIGFAPAFNPKFVILIKLDNPETKTAEYSAVPIFKELAKYIIDYYKIPPDYD